MITSTLLGMCLMSQDAAGRPSLGSKSHGDMVMLALPLMLALTMSYGPDQIDNDEDVDRTLRMMAISLIVACGLLIAALAMVLLAVLA